MRIRRSYSHFTFALSLIVPMVSGCGSGGGDPPAASIGGDSEVTAFFDRIAADLAKDFDPNIVRQGCIARLKERVLAVHHLRTRARAVPRFPDRGTDPTVRSPALLETCGPAAWLGRRPATARADTILTLTHRGLLTVKSQPLTQTGFSVASVSFASASAVPIRSQVASAWPASAGR